MIVKGPRGSIRLSRTEQGDLQVAAEGEFDVAMSLQLTDALDIDPYVNGDTDVELDLSGVTYMDSTGIRLLILTRSKVHAGGHALKITGISQFAYRVLEIAELVEFLDVTKPDGDEPRPF